MTLRPYLTSLMFSFLIYKMLMTMPKVWTMHYQSMKIGAQLEMT